MRVDLNPEAQPARESSSASSQNTAAGAGTSAGNGALALGEDQAQLSGAHAQVEGLAAQAAQLPEVRQERVEPLRQAVLSGEYTVSSEQVAGAVFAHMLAAPAA
jgi:flagellar biosynthesis anti-sigma factor FlgM